MQRGAAGAPLDDRDGQSERQRGAVVEQRGAGERADGADGDRALDLGELQGQRLAAADEREDGEQADVVGALAEDEPGDAEPDADDADGGDDEREARREREEARSDHPARPRLAALLGRLDRVGGRQRDDVLAVLPDGPELRAALLREEQRLGAGAEDAVAALELRAVDGEVGLVDELVRVGAVLRERGDADGHRRPDGLGRGLDLELALRHGAADPLGDLERLVRRRLRKEDRELLAAEAGRDVVVAQLRAEDLRDSLQHGVAGKVSVAVVDVAQQVEVGHDQRHRPLEPRGARDLGGERRREVARVVEAGLRVDARLRLQLRDAERAVDDDERRERGEHEPRVQVPERGQRDAEDREHEVDREALDGEQPRLAERMAAAELEDQGDEDVVHADVGDRGSQAGHRKAGIRIRDHAAAVPQDQLDHAPHRQRVQRVVGDVEHLDRPRVAFLQPLRDGLHERDQHQQLGRQQQRRRDEEDHRGVVHEVARRLDREHLRDRRGRGQEREGEPAVADARNLEIEAARGGDRRQAEDQEIDLRTPRQPGARARRRVVVADVDGAGGGECLGDDAHSRPDRVGTAW